MAQTARRHHDQGGWGATPRPGDAARYALRFTSLAALAAEQTAEQAASHTA